LEVKYMRKEAIPIGFLTVPLAPLGLNEVAKWAGEQGFEYLEVAAWPEKTSRTDAWVASHLGDLKDFTQARADDINAAVRGAGLKGISSLAYYENMLAGKPDERQQYHQHLKRVIDAGEKLGVKLVGTFAGRMEGTTVDGSMQEYGRVFPGLVSYATDHGRKVMFENCPMEKWVKEAIESQKSLTPEQWRIVFIVTFSILFLAPCPPGSWAGLS
jgi:sugar phosphate isomerase/epimerase